MAAVEVENLTKRYGSTTALDEVSFTVDAGECLALLGPNGAGKSTLIDVMATLASPDAGRVRIAGSSVTEDSHRVRQRVGVAFQTPITHDHLTAREVILHHASVYAMPRKVARQRADELLAFVDLGERADDRVGTFSQGMKRRVDLARVLVTEPDVLLLDEPAAGLDPRGRLAIRDRLTRLVREGTTLLVATHQMREAHALADRVAILHDGRVRALGEPGQLTSSLGEQVVRVDLAPDQPQDLVRQRLVELGVEGVRRRPGAVEAVLGDVDVSPGDVVDALEAAGLAYEEVAVHAPDLGDVFLDVTGDPLEAPAVPEVPA